MFRGVSARLSAFKADGRGVVLYLVALLMVPFVGLLGVAVDVGQLLLIKNQLAAAIDAAALDIGATPGLTQAQAQAQAQAYVDANFTTQYPLATAVVSPPALTATTVSLNATATLKTSFLKILGSGYNTLSTTVSSQVALAQNYLEVVLVLDNTGSMNSIYGSMPGIQGLQLAATTLVNTLFASDPAQKYVKIGVVPFTANVKVGTKYAGAAWIDNANAANSLSQENLDVPAGTGLIGFASQLSKATGNAGWAWGGCVRQRREPYDVQEVTPDSNTPDTLFTPFFAPDEPDPNPVCNAGWSPFFNSYLCDQSCWKSSSQADQAADQRCIAKYSSPAANQWAPGPNAMCTIQEIIRLTNDQTAILNEIDAMAASGNTVIPAGLMWGWHLLSPNGPFADGVPYSDTRTVKAIILVTDGYNDVSGGNNGIDKSVFNAYGYGSGPHLNVLSVPPGVNRPQPEYNLDQKLLQLCSNIKAVQDSSGKAGRILIYTIGFGSGIGNYGLSLLQQCATSNATYFYNPTSDELITTFQKIATGLSKLRIAK
jgi:Flp pilus assembly protein TadG